MSIEQNTAPDRPRVIAGVTGTLANLAALHAAVGYARSWRRTLVAVHVSCGPAAPAAHRLAGAFVDAFGAIPVDLDVELRLAGGAPADTLVRVADRPGDLLVVGESRRGGWYPRPAVSTRCRRRARQLVVVPRPALLRELDQVVHIRDLDGLAAL